VNARRVALVVFLAALLGQGWILGGGFLADDWGLIATMTDAGEPDLAEGIRQFAQPVPHVDAPLPEGMYPKFWRPLWWMSFAVDFGIWGARPFGFLLTNVLLHALSCVLLALLALRLGLSGRAAIAAGVLFALHPTHHEAVGWIAARCGLFAMAGVLGCVLLGLEARRRPALAVAAAGAVLLGLLSKESAIVGVPLLVVAVAAAPGQRRWSVIVAPGVVFGLWLLARRAMLGVWTGGYGMSAFDPGSSDMARAWLQRLGVLLGPGKEAVVTGPVNTAISVLVIAVLAAGVASVRARRSSGPAFIVGAAWLVLAFVPVWQFVIDPDLQHEARLLYPAAGALALLIGAALDTRQRFLVPIAGALVLAYGALTVVNSADRRAAWELSAVFEPETRKVACAQPPDTLVLLIGMPDNVGGAYVGRNAVPGLLGPPFGDCVPPNAPRGYTTREGELRRYRQDTGELPREQARVVFGWVPQLGSYRWVSTPP
jgi:protein O-mannosyl-transferase